MFVCPFCRKGYYDVDVMMSCMKKCYEKEIKKIKDKERIYTEAEEDIFLAKEQLDAAIAQYNNLHKGSYYIVVLDKREDKTGNSQTTWF